MSPWLSIAIWTWIKHDATMSDSDKHTIRRRHQRATAVSILEAVIHEVSQGRPADSVLARIFKANTQFGSRDRRMYSHCVFSYYRWLGWTQKMELPGLEHQLAWSVILDPECTDAIMEVWGECLGLPPEELLILAAAPCKVDELSRLFPNTVFSPVDLLPGWTPEVVGSTEMMTSLAAACMTRLPVWTFIPSELKSSFTTYLQQAAITFETHPRMGNAVAITSPFSIHQLAQGWGHPIQIQDIASQAVVAVCGPKPGDIWWDACCGAGGKSIGLAQGAGPTGTVYCTDVRDTMLYNLKQRVDAHGITNIKTLELDATTDAPPGQLFDGVLVDAPCSGIGTWPRNPDARWRMQLQTVQDRCRIQALILRQAARSLKNGGCLIYSVCTVTECEGPDMIRAFLKECPEFQPQHTENPLTGELMQGELMIAPGAERSDGMYIARLIKVL